MRGYLRTARKCSWCTATCERRAPCPCRGAKDAIEKGELVAAAQETMQSAGLQVPEGYGYDGASGYMFNPATGLYFDLVTSAFLNTQTQTWCAPAAQNAHVAPVRFAATARCFPFFPLTCLHGVTGV